MIGSGTYHCEQGYGALVNEMYKETPVELSTKVTEIDWSGKGVKIITDKGTISSKKCIITVSNAVLSSEKIKFTPKLSSEKQEAFQKYLLDIIIELLWNLKSYLLKRLMTAICITK